MSKVDFVKLKDVKLDKPPINKLIVKVSSSGSIQGMAKVAYDLGMYEKTEGYMLKGVLERCMDGGEGGGEDGVYTTILGKGMSRPRRIVAIGEVDGEVLGVVGVEGVLLNVYVRGDSRRKGVGCGMVAGVGKVYDLGVKVSMFPDTEEGIQFATRLGVGISKVWGKYTNIPDMGCEGRVVKVDRYPF